jgi:hypothetical protein
MQGTKTASNGAAPLPEDPTAPTAAPPIIGTKPKKGEGISSGGARGARLPLLRSPLERSGGWPPGTERSASWVRSTSAPLSSHKGSSRNFADPKGDPGANCARSPAGLCFPPGGAAGTASRPLIGSTVLEDSTARRSGGWADDAPASLAGSSLRRSTERGPEIPRSVPARR